MSLARYILRRTLWSIPTLFGISLLSFALLRAAHTDPLLARAHDPARASAIDARALEQLRSLYDLDRPWYEQYAKLVGRFVRLDLGTRWQDGRPIRDVLAESLPITVTLSAAAIACAYVLAIPLGIAAAVRRGHLFDRALGAALFLLYSLPAFWVGTLLLVFLASGEFVRCAWLPHGACFPLQGWHSFSGYAAMSWSERVLDVLWHGILPVITLSYPMLAWLSRHMRAGMLEALQRDYVRTARAKGLPERVVVLRHALPHGVLPVVTLFGLSLPQLIGGAVVVESIFGIHGMGLVALEAMRVPDYPLVITLVTFTAVLTLAGSLIADILYAVLDPRIRYAKG